MDSSSSDAPAVSARHGHVLPLGGPGGDVWGVMREAAQELRSAPRQGLPDRLTVDWAWEEEPHPSQGRRGEPGAKGGL